MGKKSAQFSSAAKDLLQAIVDSDDATDDEKKKARGALKALGDADAGGDDEKKGDVDRDDPAEKAARAQGYSGLDALMSAKFGTPVASSGVGIARHGSSSVFQDLTPEQAAKRLRELEGR